MKDHTKKSSRYQRLPGVSRVLRSAYTPRGLVVFALLFALIGAVTILSTRAAPFTLALEAESGSASGTAATVAGTGASGGQAVRFGDTTSPTPSPNPNPTPNPTPNPLPSGSLLKPANSFRSVRDLRYSDVHSWLLLDLHLPDSDGPYPLIVWIHGGAFSGGSKNDCYAKNKGMMQRGFAVACINYRLSGMAKFPAQIEDVKSAIRWLRANAATYKLYTDKIGVWGLSAGGHLSAFAGTSGNVAKFDVGANLDKSSSVQAVVDDYGPTDFLKLGQVPGFSDRLGPNSPESQLIGGAITQNPDKVALANPITYVTADDPPFRIYHGTNDTTVPNNQSVILDEALRNAGVDSKLTLINGAGHGGPQFDTAARLNEVSSFFDSHLQP